MKKVQLAVALALAGLGLSTQSAHALPFTEGDLFLGFLDQNVPGTDYVLDIGQASLYTQRNDSSFTVLTSVNGTNLSSIYNADGGAGGWYTNGQTLWGIVGGPTSTDVGNTLYASTATDQLPPSFGPGSSIGQGSNKTAHVDTMEGDYQNTGTSFNGSNGTTQSTTDTNSFAAQGFNTGTPFGFAANFAGQINNDGLGADTSLELFQVVPKGGSLPNGALIDEGAFTISSNGTVTFQSAVPEPSTFAALAGGIGILGLMRRRRAVVA